MTDPVEVLSHHVMVSPSQYLTPEIRSLLERLDAAEEFSRAQTTINGDLAESYKHMERRAVKAEEENERLRDKLERQNEERDCDEILRVNLREENERLREDYDKQGRDLEDLMEQRDVVMRREAALQEENERLRAENLALNLVLRDSVQERASTVMALKGKL